LWYAAWALWSHFLEPGASVSPHHRRSILTGLVGRAVGDAATELALPPTAMPTAAVAATAVTAASLHGLVREIFMLVPFIPSL
jgi:hypothetical protein